MISPKEIVKSLAGFSVVPVFTALITVFVIPVISNVFPAEEYGKINLFYSTGILLMTCFTLGLDNSFIRFYFEPPKGVKKEGIQALSLAVGFVATAIAALVALLFLSDLVCDYLFGESNPVLIGCMAAYVCALIAFRLLNTDARMQENYRRYSVQAILQNFFTRIAFVFVALYSTHYAYSIVAMTVGMVVLALFFLVLQRQSFSFQGTEFTKRSIGTLVSFGVPVMATNLVLNLNNAIGKLMLSGGGMYEAVGVFAIASTLANVFTVLPSAFQTYWSPFMYKNYMAESELITKMHDYVMLATGLIVAIIILCQEALFLIVGGEYNQCQVYFMLIMLNPIQALICETTSYGIVLNNKPIYNALFSAIGVCLSAGICGLLMGSLGALAAAIGVAVSSVFICLARTFVGQRMYKSIANPLKTIVSGALLIAACCLNYFAVGGFPREATLGVCLIAAFSFIYFSELKVGYGLLKGWVAIKRGK